MHLQEYHRKKKPFCTSLSPLESLETSIGDKFPNLLSKSILRSSALFNISSSIPHLLAVYRAIESVQIPSISLYLHLISSIQFEMVSCIRITFSIMNNIII